MLRNQQLSGPDYLWQPDVHDRKETRSSQPLVQVARRAPADVTQAQAAMTRLALIVPHPIELRTQGTRNPNRAVRVQRLRDDFVLVHVEWTMRGPGVRHSDPAGART